MKIKNANDARFYFEMAIFASFKLNDDQQPTEIVQPIVKQIKVEPTVIKNNFKLPNPTEVFSYTEHKTVANTAPVIKNQVKPQEPVKKTAVSPNISINDLFLQIAYNYTKAAQSKAKDFLQYVKTLSAPGHLADIIPAVKVLVASKYGIVLEFDDDLDAELLNSQAYKYDFLKEVKQYFEYPVYIIGVEKDKTSDIVMNYQQEKKRGRAFDEPDVKKLDKILKSNNAAEQLAIEMFGN